MKAMYIAWTECVSSGVKFKRNLSTVRCAAAVYQRWQKSTFQAQNANTLRRSTASLVGNNVSTGTFTRNVAVRVVKKSKWIKLKLAGGKFEGIERGDG